MWVTSTWNPYDANLIENIDQIIGLLIAVVDKTDVLYIIVAKQLSEPSKTWQISFSDWSWWRLEIRNTIAIFYLSCVLMIPCRRERWISDDFHHHIDRADDDKTLGLFPLFSHFLNNIPAVQRRPSAIYMKVRPVGNFCKNRPKFTFYFTVPVAGICATYLFSKVSIPALKSWFICIYLIFTASPPMFCKRFVINGGHF